MPDSLNMFMISSQFGKGNEMKMNSSEKELKEHEMNEKEMKTNTYCIQLLHNVPVTQQLKDMFGSNFWMVGLWISTPHQRGTFVSTVVHFLLRSWLNKSFWSYLRTDFEGTRLWRKTGATLGHCSPPLSQEILALLKRCPSARKVRLTAPSPRGRWRLKRMEQKKTAQKGWSWREKAWF